MYDVRFTIYDFHCRLQYLKAYGLLLTNKLRLFNRGRAGWGGWQADRCNPWTSECVPLFNIAEDLLPVYGRLKKENHW